MLRHRLKAAFQASGWHLLASCFVAGVAAALVFGVLYPPPFASMLGGFSIFVLVVTVDVVCGPLLTLVLFNPVKPRKELTFDLGFIACVQVCALVYGLHTVWVARPVFLVYEIDRFRLLTLAEMDPSSLDAIPPVIGGVALAGSKQVGVRVAQPSDSDYLTQLDLSLQGQELAFRTERWVPYEEVGLQALSRSHSMSTLVTQYEERRDRINMAISRTGRTSEELKWLPTASRLSSGWTALLDARTAKVVGWVQLDGFGVSNP